MPHAPCSKLSVLFRCDGSPEIGLGHIVRCLALANELRDVHNCRISFAMRIGTLGIKMVEEKGYQVLSSEETDQSFNYRNWLNECIRNVEAKAIILDVRDELPRKALDELRSDGILIITIDDPEEKRLSADLAFYPPVPQVKRIDWTGFTGKLYVGWEWVILRKEFCTAPSPQLRAPCAVLSAPCPMPHAPKVLVTMGGSDPQGMTIKAVKALEMLDEDFEVVVILGTGFQHKEELDNSLSHCMRRYDVRKTVQEMAEIMSQSDLAVASFGVTAYELAAMGVPAIYLCLTEDHAESASVFVKTGMAICLGVNQQVTKKDIASVIGMTLQESEKLELMRNRAIRSIDGKGAERIAHAIVDNLIQISNYTKG